MKKTISFTLISVIHDSKLLTTVQSSTYFKRLINELDPVFKVPDVKLIKKMIHQAYNHCSTFEKVFFNTIL